MYLQGALLNVAYLYIKLFYMVFLVRFLFDGGVFFQVFVQILQIAVGFFVLQVKIILPEINTK